VPEQASDNIPWAALFWNWNIREIRRLNNPNMEVMERARLHLSREMHNKLKQHKNNSPNFLHKTFYFRQFTPNKNFKEF
jgi:hypothetical protein